MGDFSAAGVVWAVVITLVGVSYTVGYTSSSENTYNECQDFGKVKVSNSIYECKLFKNKH